jgi:hypothetical protein
LGTNAPAANARRLAVGGRVAAAPSGITGPESRVDEPSFSVDPSVVGDDPSEDGPLSRAGLRFARPFPGLASSLLDELAAATKSSAANGASTTLRMPVASNKRRAVRLGRLEVEGTGESGRMLEHDLSPQIARTEGRVRPLLSPHSMASLFRLRTIACVTLLTLPACVVRLADRNSPEPNGGVTGAPANCGAIQVLPGGAPG